MKTKLTSTLAALAALILLAATPANNIAGVIAIESNPCAINRTPIYVTKIDVTATRINNLIPAVIAKDEIINALVIKDIEVNIADIGLSI